MRSFVDTLGREWKLSINLGTVREIKRALKLDLLDDPQAIKKLTGDIELLVNALFVVVAEQAKAANVSDIQFAEGMGGDTFDLALEAFMGELIDFSPGPRRGALKKIWETLRTLQTAASERAIAKLSGPTMAAAIESQLANMEREIEANLSGLASGKLPAPPA